MPLLIKNIDFSRLKAEEQISKLIAGYPKTRQIYPALLQNVELRALWDACNYFALKKLLYPDHGPIHGFVAARNAIIMLQLLKQNKILTDLIQDGRGDWDDVHLIVMTAALFHDIGNAIHRDLHWLTGPILLQSALDRELRSVYDEKQATFLKVSIFDMIYSHEAAVQKMTMEASLVGLGDYTDITKGRATGSLGEGEYNIHTVSTSAIEQVTIKPGDRKPILITVELSNSAGIFPVQEMLMKNLISGKLKDYVEIIAKVVPLERKTEKRILSTVDITNQGNSYSHFKNQ